MPSKAYRTTLERFKLFPTKYLRNAVHNLNNGWECMDGKQNTMDFRSRKKL